MLRAKSSVTTPECEPMTPGSWRAQVRSSAGESKHWWRGVEAPTGRVSAYIRGRRSLTSARVEADDVLGVLVGVRLGSKLTYMIVTNDVLQEFSTVPQRKDA